MKKQMNFRYVLQRIGFGWKRPAFPLAALILLFSAGYDVRGQENQLQSLQDKFNSYTEHSLQEKIYMHVDKEFYLAGEIIWFKIYDVDCADNHLLDMSKLAYVEIISNDQKSVLQAKIELRNGTGNGSFFLPTTLPSGIYTLRAYTSWMKNFESEYFFNQQITIVNSLHKPIASQAALTSSYDIHFFPEGGNLVEGIESTVGFKIVDREGKGVTFKGTLIDHQNKPVLEFEPSAFGMGRFSFVPIAGESYRAVIRLQDNNVVVNELPKAYPSGYVLTLKDSASGQVHLKIRTNIAEAEDHFVYLLVHTRQVAKLALIAKVLHGQSDFTIDKQKLGEGISCFTVFNPQAKPVCERLYCRRPEAASMDAGTNQGSYSTRQKVTLNLLLYGQADIASKPSLSLSVYPLDSIQRAPKADILSYLWLASDISGYIESPNYYFQDSSAASSLALDNLMITQGWRRFRWEDVLAERRPSIEFPPEYTGHIISGKVIDKKTGRGVPNVYAFVAAPGTRYQVSSALSDEEGQVRFDLKNFYNTGSLVVEADKNDSAYRVDISNPFSEAYPQLPGFESGLGQEQIDPLLLHSIGTQVQNAFLADSLQQIQIQSIADSTPFYGNPDHKYFLDEYTRFNTMEEVLREYVTDINVRKRQKKFQILAFNDPMRQFFDGEPLMLFDGVPVFDADKIIGFDPLKLKKIEVVNREYFLGPLTSYGIISFSTYNGDLAGFQLDPNALVVEYEGIQAKREFYAPSYRLPEEAASRIPDFRNQLYWTPDIELDKTGRKQISFYTSDRTGNYIGVIQGITADGKAVSKTFNFEVTH